MQETSIPGYRNVTKDDFEEQAAKVPRFQWREQSSLLRYHELDLVFYKVEKEKGKAEVTTEFGRIAYPPITGESGEQERQYFIKE